MPDRADIGGVHQRGPMRRMPPGRCLMSRGHGAVQRRILEQLKLNTNDPAADDRLHPTLAFASWTTVLDLAGDGATRAQIESIRRAVLKLAAEGLVETRHVRGRGRERPLRSNRVCSYGDPYGRLYPVHDEGSTTSPWLLAARLSVDNVTPSAGSQHLTPEQSARFVMTGEMPEAPLSVDNAESSGSTQHLTGTVP